MFPFLVSRQGCFPVLGCQAVECDLSLWKKPRVSFASRAGRANCPPVQTPVTPVYLWRPPGYSLPQTGLEPPDYVSHFCINMIRPFGYVPKTGF